MIIRICSDFGFDENSYKFATQAVYNGHMINAGYCV